MNVLVIGGGAGGIACAIKLKQNNIETEVTVLEHLDEVCKKIYATGNGRCNMTNINAQHYEVTKSFFDSIGVIMRTDHAGRVYPYSNQSGTVVSAMKSQCQKLGVNIVTGCEAQSIAVSDGIYNVYTNNGTYSADVVVLATGGMSQSTLGSDGSGYRIAKDMGLDVTELSPALVQLKSPSKNCHALKGVRAKCNVAIETDGVVVAQDYGELLFADYGISGIVTMNLSGYISDKRLRDNLERSVAVIDFVPEMSLEQLLEHYGTFGTYEGILPQKLVSIISRQANNDSEKAAQYIKNWRLIITGTKGFDFAQITKGGVDKSQLLPTGEVVNMPGLYVIGELTDNQFECGGFNLDFAFSGGVIAADDITNKYDKN
ncbi:MAG: aminoacetone oxidase family FAD-binding enzyme [Eubacteriales bacterium]|nr:aminoacetone oxidase family FAD-binding enzyme [Eubacteriales bacterium]